jgi:hypothetical protein
MQCLLTSNQYAYAYDGVALLSKVNMRCIFIASSAYYYVGLLYVLWRMWPTSWALIDDSPSYLHYYACIRHN